MDRCSRWFDSGVAIAHVSDQDSRIGWRVAVLNSIFDAEACEFSREHGGTRIVGFEQVDTKLLSGLDRWPRGEK